LGLGPARLGDIVVSGSSRLLLTHAPAAGLLLIFRRLPWHQLLARHV